MLLDDRYPLGKIEIQPAIDGGITETFQHQALNRPADTEVPWREGALCVDRPGVHLRGPASVGEPIDAANRLAWHLTRAREWLSAAATNTLAASGDPYEAPPFAHTTKRPMIYYAEDPSSLSAWTSRFGRTGTVCVSSINNAIAVVRSMEDSSGASITAPKWGLRVDSGMPNQAFWIALPAEPVLQEWSTPQTWGAFFELARLRNWPLEERLKSVIAQGRRSRHIGRTVVLIGFPIPEVVGGQTVEMHWQAILLPQLCGRSPDGFRDNEQWRYWRDRREGLADHQRIEWISTHNVSNTHLAVRGSLPEALRDRRILLIGCGALGSVIAELLIRKGLQHLTLVDGQTLEVGNLRRHMLGLDHVDSPKAAALAEHLNNLSLFARVVSKDDFMPEVLQHDIVIDATANDDVPQQLFQLVDGQRIFISFSIGAYARCLFACGSRGPGFPWQEYRQEIDRYRPTELALLESDPAIRDVGCHNPTFPAPIEGIWVQACHAISFLERFIGDDEPFRFEREEE